MKFTQIRFLIFISAFLSFVACQSDSKNDAGKSNKTITAAEDLPENNLKFKDVNGIRFFEVKRRFRNGLSRLSLITYLAISDTAVAKEVCNSTESPQSSASFMLFL